MLNAITNFMPFPPQLHFHSLCSILVRRYLHFCWCSRLSHCPHLACADACTPSHTDVHNLQAVVGAHGLFTRLTLIMCRSAILIPLYRDSQLTFSRRSSRYSASYHSSGPLSGLVHPGNYRHQCKHSLYLVVIPEVCRTRANTKSVCR